MRVSIRSSKLLPAWDSRKYFAECSSASFIFWPVSSIVTSVFLYSLRLEMSRTQPRPWCNVALGMKQCRNAQSGFARLELYALNQIDDGRITKAAALRSQISGRLANCARQPILCFFVIGLAGLGYLRIDFSLLSNRNCARGFCHHSPAIVFVFLQIKIDARKMTGPAISLSE